MKLETKIIQDIKGNDLKYLIITNSKGNQMFISVGDKTIRNATELIYEEENKTQNSKPLKLTM